MSFIKDLTTSIITDIRRLLYCDILPRYIELNDIYYDEHGKLTKATAQATLDNPHATSYIPNVDISLGGVVKMDVCEGFDILISIKDDMWTHIKSILEQLISDASESTVELYAIQTWCQCFYDYINTLVDIEIEQPTDDSHFSRMKDLYALKERCGDNDIENVTDILAHSIDMLKLIDSLPWIKCAAPSK